MMRPFLFLKSADCTWRSISAKRLPITQYTLKAVLGAIIYFKLKHCLMFCFRFNLDIYMWQLINTKRQDTMDNENVITEIRWQQPVQRGASLRRGCAIFVKDCRYVPCTCMSAPGILATAQPISGRLKQNRWWHRNLAQSCEACNVAKIHFHKVAPSPKFPALTLHKVASRLRLHTKGCAGRV